MDQKIEKWGVEKVFSNQSESVTRELRAYIEDWGELSMKKNDKRTCTQLLAKYGGLYLYDIDFDRICSIDDEDIHFVKGDGYALIGNPDQPYGTSTDHEYFFIHDDSFKRILKTD